VFTVPDVLPKRMSSRLTHICKVEQLEHDRHAVADLCQLADGDIRSCLMTLQFLKRSQKCVTSASIVSSNVGIKDQVKSLFPIWEDIFHRQSDKSKYIKMLRKGADIGKDASQIKSDPGYLYNLEQVDRHPEHDKLMEGCFEHYLKIKYSDIDGRKTAICADSFSWLDVCSQVAFKYQTPQLRKFIPFGIAQMHMNCAVPRKPPRLEYPRSWMTNRTTSENNTSILRTLYEGLPVHIQPFARARQMGAEVLSFLLRIINPKLKVSLSNMNILSAKDKADLKELTQKHVEFNIGYIGQTDGHQLTWSMDIAIERLVEFTGITPTFTALPAALRQLLAREIKFEKVRQAAQAMCRDGPSAAETAKAKLQEEARIKEAAAQKLKQETEDKIKQMVSKKRPANAVKRDFFGRVVSDAAVKTQSLAAKSKAKAQVHPIKYQYQEGYTNAIRRPVNLQDFL